MRLKFSLRTRRPRGHHRWGRDVPEATAGLRNRQIGFQVLTSMAVIGAVLLTMWEEALIVVILVAFTQHLEGDALVRARRPCRVAWTVCHAPLDVQTSLTTRSLRSPWALPPPPCRRCRLPARGGRVGRRPSILFGPGTNCRSVLENSFPDGRIVAGSGSLDMAPLTGESVPVDVESGDELNAGLVLQRGPVEIEVTATGDETRLSGLIEAVHTFREEPPRLQGLVERFTTIWVPIVLFGSVVIWRVRKQLEEHAVVPGDLGVEHTWLLPEQTVQTCHRHPFLGRQRGR